MTCDDEVKLRIFRRKNIDTDDFDEKLKIRGMSEPYVEENNTDTLENRERSPKSRERKISESVNPLSPHPGTPSTSGIRHSRHATPSEGLKSYATPLTCPSTPQQCTPQGRRGKLTPCTPKTGERNMLLQWLASSKTPTSHESPVATSMSDNKKINHKRKLADLMDENQENVSDKEKPAKSPIKDRSNILGSSFILNSQSPPSASAVKMLKYGDDPEAVSLGMAQDESNIDITNSVHPIDANVKMTNDFWRPVTNGLVAENSIVADKSSDKRSHADKQNVVSGSHKEFGKFSSPTANLPNYIVDGTSPHSRPEEKIEKKRNVNWLTSITHQRKLKFSKTPIKVIKNGASPKSVVSHKGGV